MSSLSKEDYTIGWICAIESEYIAARGVLEEEYPPVPGIDSNRDKNSYTFGRIGGHRVVIAVMPMGKYGTTSVATVASHMLNSFGSIKFGLMVGIAGGAPSDQRDIRLGDIVVSAPDTSTQAGGVIQYDYGKTIQTKEFQRTGFLSSPPLQLLATIRTLQGLHKMQGHKIARTVETILTKYERLRKQYQRPPVEEDRLYKPGFLHVNDERSCREVCGNDDANVKKRPVRGPDDDDPTIHYGLIASANQLMKNAIVRDRLSAKERVLCFEMESAGLMDHFPCLVIRGICDYSDTHKNDIWHGYAAVVAAAYAKELLELLPATEVRKPENPKAAHQQADIPTTLFRRENAARAADMRRHENVTVHSNTVSGGGTSFIGGRFNSGGGAMSFN